MDTPARPCKARPHLLRLGSRGGYAPASAWLALCALVVSALLPGNGVAATPAPVDASTTSVAAIPRPQTIVIPPKTDCPHDDPTLVAFDPAWLAPNGMLELPAATRALLRGNLELSAGTLIRELRVPSGSELVFDDRPTQLRIRDLRVAGALRLGSPTCRLESAILISFDTDEDVSDPMVRAQIHARAGLGLVVEPGGVLEVFGRLFQPTWTRLGATANAGSSVIQLAEAVDWEAGQKVVVVTSAMRDYPILDQNEVRAITAVNGTMITLDTALSHTHYGGAEYQVEVGLLSRSIVFETAGSLISAASTFGGHVMAHAAQIRISGVELRRLGQQNFLGRYPFHLHHAGDVAGQSYLADSSIHDSNWRCAVIHRTDNAIVSKNVAYDVWGHCYYIEDGVEQGNELSYNLAARIKILGATDSAALDALKQAGQEGFELLESSAFANPADRAAAGFYITNGDNEIFGNAASGGFVGYSFPNLPEATGGIPSAIVPLAVQISGFDGNTAHTSGYLWPDGSCVYVGGALEIVDDGGVDKLRYRSGRPDFSLLRTGPDVFSNLKTFLCDLGLVHWGDAPQIVNFESWDNGMMAQVFGEASIRSAIVTGETGNTPNLTYRPLAWWRRGFRFYDTGNLTILRDIVFRNFRSENPSPNLPSQDNCVFLTLVHSDEFTPQRMLAMSGMYYDGVADSQRFCHDDSGTLSSRNFNLVDEDGSATFLAGDGVPVGGRIAGSVFTDAWNLSPQCVRNDDWNLWMCPATGPEHVASVRSLPNQGVRVLIYRLDGIELGENAYATDAEYGAAQITGPSGVAWHHSFPSGIPETVDVHALQVPEGSFLIYSLTLPEGVSCAVNETGWAAVADLGTLLGSTGGVYTTQDRTCFVRIPEAFRGYFSAAGSSIPRLTWPGTSTLSDFTLTTGCTMGNPACLDGDGDGIDDAHETAGCTDPLDLDSDDDGLGDGEEDANGNGVVDPGESDPCSVDSDGDGIQDGTESGRTSGLPDPDGIAPGRGTDLAIFVPDPDPGLVTDPTLADTDGDGLDDLDEQSFYQTNPADSDTDGDGLDDGFEIHVSGSSPLDPDTDGDGLLDRLDPDLIGELAGMIDDVEDADLAILPIEGRFGYWFLVDDASGSLSGPTAIAGIGHDGGVAIGSTGSGFSIWGAILGLSFRSVPGPGGAAPGEYDASSYAGISFWMRGDDGAGGPISVRVEVTTPATTAQVFGGECTTGCGDHFQIDLGLQPGPWQRFELRWEELAQAGWGETVDAFDPSTVMLLQFGFGSGVDFDVQVDDIAFLPGPTAPVPTLGWPALSLLVVGLLGAGTWGIRQARAKSASRT